MWSGTGALLLSLSPDSHRGPSLPSTKDMGPGITLLFQKLTKVALGILQGAWLCSVRHLDGSLDPEQDDLNPFGHHCSHPKSVSHWVLYLLRPAAPSLGGGGLIPPTTSLTSSLWGEVSPPGDSGTGLLFSLSGPRHNKVQENKTEQKGSFQGI